MQTVQVVLDEELLAETDQAAKKCRLNRSAWVRMAIRAYLETQRAHELELLDRNGYVRIPDTADEMEVWDDVAAWPEDSWPEA